MESDGFSDDDDFMEGLGGMIQRETGKPDIKPEVKKKPDGKTEVTKQPNPIKPDFDDDFSDDDFFADAFESATQKQRVDPPPNTSKQNGANKQVNKQSTPARDVKPTNGTMKEDDDDDWGDDSFFMDALQSQIKWNSKSRFFDEKYFRRKEFSTGKIGVRISCSPCLMLLYFYLTQKPHAKMI